MGVCGRVCGCVWEGVWVCVCVRERERERKRDKHVLRLISFPYLTYLSVTPKHSPNLFLIHVPTTFPSLTFVVSKWYYGTMVLSLSDFCCLQMVHFASREYCIDQSRYVDISVAHVFLKTLQITVTIGISMTVRLVSCLAGLDLN